MRFIADSRFGIKGQFKEHNMPNNREKFSIEEGIFDYLEEKEDADLEKKKRDSEIAAERAVKANETITHFYSEGLEKGSKHPSFPLREKLVGLPNDFRIAVFQEWLLRDPIECLWQMDEFETLPNWLQKDIAEYLSSNELSN